MIRKLVLDMTSFPDICLNPAITNSFRNLKNIIAILQAKNNPKISKIEIDLKNFEPKSSFSIKISLGAILQKLEMMERCYSIRSNMEKRQLQKRDESTTPDHVTGMYV